MNNLTKIIQQNPILAYFFLAYAFAWLFTPLIAMSAVYGIPALFAPALAGILVSRATGGRDQVGLLLRKLTIWRVNILWYLVALGLPFFLSFLIPVLGRFFIAELPFQLSPISLLGIVVFVLVVGEELGWRGYAQPQLGMYYSPLVAALILGVLWGLWHLPNFYTPGLPHNEIPLTAFVVYTTGLSVVAAWLLKHTRGSVLIATLLHGATNTFGFLTPGLDIVTRWWLIASVYGVATFLIVIIFGTKLHRTRSATSPDSILVTTSPRESDE